MRSQQADRRRARERGHPYSLRAGTLQGSKRRARGGRMMLVRNGGGSFENRSVPLGSEPARVSQMR